MTLLDPISYTSLLIAADFIGNPNGSGIPFGNRTSDGQPDVHEAFPIQSLAGPITADGGGVGVIPEVAVPAAGDVDLISFAGDWFEDVHILPRTPIEFGQIITQVEESYEIYSAYRWASIVLTALTNNAAPGVELPDIALSDEVGPQGSLLDPATPNNSGGALLLGDHITLQIQALPEGLPAFDSSVVFTFGGEFVTLFLTGSRLVLLTPEYETPVTEGMEFLTEVQSAFDGAEVRISPRGTWRETLNPNYVLSDTDRQRLATILFDWQDQIFGVPMYHQRMLLASTVSVGATSYTVVGNIDDVDLRVGGIAVAFTDDLTFDVITISGLSGSVITADSPSLNGYPAGTFIMPVRTMVMTRDPSMTRYPVKLQDFSLDFIATDNTTGVMTGDASPWDTYDGKILIDSCNFMQATTLDAGMTRQITTIDNLTGNVSVSSAWDKAKQQGQLGFIAYGRQQIRELKRLLIEIRGRQASFYVPTRIEEMTVTDGMLSGLFTFKISNIGYYRYVAARSTRNVIRMTFTDGTSIVRVIQSAALDLDTAKEVITVDVAHPADRTADEVSRIEFYEPVRFDTDRFKIEHRGVAEARMKAPIITVFEE